MPKWLDPYLLPSLFEPGKKGLPRAVDETPPEVPPIPEPLKRELAALLDPDWRERPASLMPIMVRARPVPLAKRSGQPRALTNKALTTHLAHHPVSE